MSNKITRALPSRRLPAPAERDRWLPAAYAGGMLAFGAALLVAKPSVGHVPDARPFGAHPRKGRLRRAAGWARDSTHALAPSNVTDSIGRALVIGGLALLITRFLDELAGRD
ncbi:hypothetical protein [Pseudoroseicyclus tamaricis]|uniref:Uncharacterized protein n=1 Tax=Pseudoroseicyclus tamaricis TaxID=2705421 RepID=A0A6B2K3V2_9RHOB|nr:hypothetical protein [Pseudoroseicyclus tamaricis]NDV02492.1 hypothetical protein [Pseudoroseicyclus tamaricis]